MPDWRDDLFTELAFLQAHQKETEREEKLKALHQDISTLSFERALSLLDAWEEEKGFQMNRDQKELLAKNPSILADEFLKDWRKTRTK